MCCSQPAGTTSQVTERWRAPSSPASMRTWVRRRCHSSTGASVRRLTSTSRFYQNQALKTSQKAFRTPAGSDLRLLDDQIDELARHDDLFHDLRAIEVFRHVLVAFGEPQELFLRAFRGR